MSDRSKDQQKEEKREEKREERHEDVQRPEERRNSLTGPTGKEHSEFSDLVTDWSEWSEEKVN